MTGLYSFVEEAIIGMNSSPNYFADSGEAVRAPEYRLL
jgi:hypothetical protein